MQKPEQAKDFSIVKPSLVYIMPGSSTFHRIDDLHVDIYFGISFHDKYMTLVYFLEFLFPPIVDLMINFDVDVYTGPDFYKNDKFVSKLVDHINKYTLKEITDYFRKSEMPMQGFNENSNLNDELIKTIKEDAPRLIEKRDNNPLLYKENTFYLEGGRNRQFILTTSKVVLDKVLLWFDVCDRMHNRDMLAQNSVMTFTDYLMMRKHCRPNPAVGVSFSLIETEFIFQMLDISAQILSGKMADKILAATAEETLNHKDIGLYLAEMDKFSKECRITFENADTKFGASLFPYFDWNEAFK